MMGAACLEMKDDAPDEAENNRRVAIGNARGGDARQLHLKARERRVNQDEWLCAAVWRPADALACLSPRNARTLEMFFSLKTRWGGDLNLWSLTDAFVCSFHVKTHIIPALISLHSWPMSWY